MHLFNPVSGVLLGEAISMLAFCAAGPLNNPGGASIQASGDDEVSTPPSVEPVRLEARKGGEQQKGKQGGDDVEEYDSMGDALLDLPKEFEENKATDDAAKTPGKKKKHWWQLL
jgi:hypothetical protein